MPEMTVREGAKWAAPGPLQRTAELLSQVEHNLTRGLRRVLEQEGSSIEQWRALSLLADGASHAMSELAECALLPAPTLTRLIDRMVSDNLVYRKADPLDRRRVLVLVTDRGRALSARLEDRIAADQEVVLADAQGSDVAELSELLAELAERLRACGGSSTVGEEASGARATAHHGARGRRARTAT